MPELLAELYNEKYCKLNPQELEPLAETVFHRLNVSEAQAKKKMLIF